MQSKKDLLSIKKLKLNAPALAEFNQLKDKAIDYAIKSITEEIASLRYSNGRKIRSERRASMIMVMRVLYHHLAMGDCYPSMRSIAFLINPFLSEPQNTDSAQTKKHKEKAIAKTVMLVQRTIHVLADFGFIRIHEYRAETNQDVFHNANFYYEIVPVSQLSKAFAMLLDKGVRAMSKLANLIDSVKKSVLKIAESNKDFVAPWAFNMTQQQKYRRIFKEEVYGKSKYILS